MMPRRAIRLASKAAFLAACLATISGCGLLRSRNQSGSVPVANPSHGNYAPALRLAQLNYGDEASFAYCLFPACPVTTPKTVGVRATAVSFQPELDGGGAPVEKPEQAVAAAPVEKRAENVLLYFPPGGVALDTPGKTALAQFAEVARQSHRIVVAGRTDDTGSAGTNRRVAVERASNVERYIRKELGPVTGLVETDAKGACCYVSSNSSEAGRKNNRRVEVTFLIDRD